MAKAQPPGTLVLPEGTELYGVATVDPATGRATLDRLYNSLTTDIEAAKLHFSHRHAPLADLVRFRARHEMRVVELVRWESMQAWHADNGINPRKKGAGALMAQAAAATGHEGFARVEPRLGWSAFWMSDLNASFVAEARLEAEDRWVLLAAPAEGPAAAPGMR